MLTIAISCDQSTKQCGRFLSYTAIDGECKAVVDINDQLFAADANCNEGYVKGDEVCSDALIPLRITQKD